METLLVSSEQVKYFLTECVAPQARKLRSAADYMQTAGKETLHCMDQGTLPAWAFNHQAVQEVYQAEGALLALRVASAAILRTVDDNAAFGLVLANPDYAHFIKVVAEPRVIPHIDEQMVGWPDGWYVFNSEGTRLSGPHDNEQDADDVARFTTAKPGKPWVGQLNDGVVDISYSPENIN